MMRACILFIPDWSIVAAVAAGECAPESTVLVMEKGIVRECSAAARQAGVRVGMRRRDAHALSPDALLLPHSDVRDNAASNDFLVWLSHWVPQHFLVRPGVVGLGARGVARFYGGEMEAGHFLRDLGKTYNPSVDIRIGIADDVFTAVTAATRSSADHPITRVSPGSSQDFLADLPLDVLGDSEIVSLLLSLGIYRVGDFVALGESAIRERFGLPGEYVYRLARGEQPVNWNLTDAPVDPEETIELSEPHHRVDHIAFAIRHRTEDYHTRLLAAGVVCTKVSITLLFDNGYEHHREWIHPRFFSPAELVDRVRWQLEQHGREGHQNLDYPPGVVAVRYRALRPETVSAHEPGLWGQGPDARVHQVFSRVQGLVGAHGVVTAQSARGRMPSDSQVLTLWGDRSPSRDDVAPLPGALPKPLPATVFSRATAISLHDGEGHLIEVRGTELSGEPIVMRWHTHQRLLVSWAGPWPIFERWWDSAGGRCRYRLQVLDDHGVGWLVSADQNSQWSLDARYD